MAGIEFRILGPLEVSCDGRLVDLGRRRQRTLLALLLTHANEIVPRDRVIDELWGEAAPPTALSMVQVAVSRLRKAIGQAGVLVSQAPGYMVRAGEQQLDTLRFQSLVERARQVLEQGDSERALALLLDALALWRGPPLLEFSYESFAQAEARRLEELRLEAIELRLDADLALGRVDGLQSEIEQLVEAHPFRERLRGQLMLALYRAGRQADALAAYREARAALVEQLGLEPGPALQRLEQAILAQDPLLDGPSAARPRAPKEPGPPHNLPPELTSLIGRDREIERVSQLIADHRLVTIVGPAGVGKTRLAERAARLALLGFPDGGWIVDLAAIDNPADVPASAATALRVRELEAQGLMESIAATMAGRELLLVLDNCEHVLPGAASFVAQVLRRCPGFKVVATSREPLAIAGERVFRLEPLAWREEDPESVAPAVALFLDRAAMHGVESDLTARRRETIGEVCQRLDGIPLAIELAAARSRALAPEEILERLGERWRLLAQPSHWTTHARQQTLEAAIDWSYSLLTGDEQATLRRLATFRGGFSLAAAGRLCAGIGSELDTLERLTSLVDRSMVTIDRRFDRDRYRLLESIGLFAEQRLREHGEEADARGRHSRFFLELAQRAAAEREGPGQVSSAKRLDAEDENLIAALTWSLEGVGERAVGAELAACVGTHWTSRGRTSVAKRWLEQALESDEVLAPAIRVSLNMALAAVCYGVTDLDGLRRHALEAARISRGGDDVASLAATLSELAAAHLACGEDAAAANIAAELRTLQPRLTTPQSRIRALISTAVSALAARDATQACSDAASARRICRDVGDHRRASVSGYWLGYALALDGDLPAAREAMAWAMQDAVRSGYEDAVSDATSGEGELALAAGDLDVASHSLARAAPMFRQQDRLSDFGAALRDGALIEFHRDEPDRSSILLGASERWAGDSLIEFQTRMLLPELTGLSRALEAALGARRFSHALERGRQLSSDEAEALLSPVADAPPPGHALRRF
jgi:predicted ATPase/DNA-binding SARP family transcriptional activator